MDKFINYVSSLMKISCLSKKYLCFVLSLGFSISAARLALPDVGLISYGEMLDEGRQILQAVSIPIIADGDNGYGNAMNVKRTIRDAIRAGYAGIFLEDQVYTIEKILIFITSSFVPTLLLLNLLSLSLTHTHT